MSNDMFAGENFGDWAWTEKSNTQSKHKYLISTARQKPDSMEYFVKMSGKTLRRVRDGASLQSVLNVSNYDKQHESPRPFIGDSERMIALSHLKITSNASSKFQSTSRVNDSIMPIQTKKHRQTIVSPSSKKHLSNLQILRYGRRVRFQASDGGFLCINNNGLLSKVSKKRASDPRTILTLFPCGQRSAKDKARCVRDSEPVYIVQGVESLYDSHHVVHGNSEGLDAAIPTEFVAAMKKLKDIYSDVDNSLDNPQRNCHDRINEDQNNFTNHSYTDQSVWCLYIPKLHNGVSKCSENSPQRYATNGPLVRNESDSQLYFYNGMTCELAQNGKVLYYEYSELESEMFHFDPVKYTANIQVSKHFMNSKSKDKSNETPFNFATSAAGQPVWLYQQQHRASSTLEVKSGKMVPKYGLPPQWNSLWRILDVEYEQQEKKIRLCRSRGAIHLNEDAIKHEISYALSTPWCMKSRNSEDKCLSWTNLMNNHAKLTEAYETNMFQRQKAAMVIFHFLRKHILIPNLEPQKFRNSTTINHISNNDAGSTATDARLAILQCYKPDVYGTNKLGMGLAKSVFQEHRVRKTHANTSLNLGQATHTAEKRRLELINNALTFLDSPSFHRKCHSASQFATIPMNEFPVVGQTIPPLTSLGQESYRANVRHELERRRELRYKLEKVKIQKEQNGHCLFPDQVVEPRPNSPPQSTG